MLFHHIYIVDNLISLYLLNFYLQEFNKNLKYDIIIQEPKWYSEPGDTPPALSPLSLAPHNPLARPPQMNPLDAAQGPALVLGPVRPPGPQLNIQFPPNLWAQF